MTIRKYEAVSLKEELRQLFQNYLDAHPEMSKSGALRYALEEMLKRDREREAKNG